MRDDEEVGVGESEGEVEGVEIGVDGGVVVGVDDGDGLAGAGACGAAEGDLVEAVGGADFGGGVALWAGGLIGEQGIGVVLVGGDEGGVGVERRAWEGSQDGGEEGARFEGFKMHGRYAGVLLFWHDVSLISWCRVDVTLGEWGRQFKADLRLSGVFNDLRERKGIWHRMAFDAMKLSGGMCVGPCRGGSLLAARSY